MQIPESPGVQKTAAPEASQRRNLGEKNTKTVCWKKKMCQWFETFSTENSFNRPSASWRIVSTSQNSAQSRVRLAVAPVSKGTESLSTPSKQTCFVFFFRGRSSTLFDDGGFHTSHSRELSSVSWKGNTYPSTLLMRGNKDIFAWPVSLKLSNSNCFFPPRNRKQVGNVFRSCSENTKDSVQALFPLVSQHGQP